MYPTLVQAGSRDFRCNNRAWYQENIRANFKAMLLLFEAKKKNLTYSYMGMYYDSHGKGSYDIGCVQRDR